MPEAPAANLITDRPAGAVPISKLQVASAGRLTTRNRFIHHPKEPLGSLSAPSKALERP